MGLEVGKPTKRLGAWLARSLNTVYQAATDGQVIVHDTTVGGTGANKIYVKTDGSDPPTTIRGESFDSDGDTQQTITIPVRKNDYWKVEWPNTADVWWIPWEF